MAKETTGKKRSASGRPIIDAERRSYVGQVVRKYRTAAGMDQAVLAGKLGFSKTAVGNWELGLTRPDIDTIPRLCKELHIPVTELLDMPPETALPPEDKAILDAYHQLDKFDRNTIRMLIDRLLFQEDRMEKNRLRNAYKSIFLYEDAAAAGIGTPMLDYAENKAVYALKANIPHGTNALIHINGRSMEPTFEDGGYAYVDTTATVQYGQIGIFIVNGEAFIKEYQPDGLHSHNIRYKTIYTGDGVDVRCCGRVLGAVAEGDLALGALAEKVEAAFEEMDDE